MTTKYFRALLCCGLALSSLSSQAKEKIPATQIVTPEQPRYVVLSNSDLNRISCSTGTVKEVYYSKEKGIEHTIEGSNIFVKFFIKDTPTAKGRSNKHYAKKRSEFFISCDGIIYTIYAIPEPTPAQHVVLTHGKEVSMQQNIQSFSGSSIEEIALQLTQQAITNQLDDNYLVTYPNNKFSLKLPTATTIKLKHLRSIAIEGTGYILKEYQLSTETTVQLQEKDFAQAAIGDNILALTLLPLDHRISKAVPGKLYAVVKTW